MTQDKIKQAFEAWKENQIQSIVGMPEVEARKKLENVMTPDGVWLAACEWLMSQGQKDFKAWFREARLEDRIEFSWKDWAEFAWQASRLSCAKELAQVREDYIIKTHNLEIELSEKDKEIEHWKKSRNNFLKEVESQNLRIAALESELRNIYWKIEINAGEFVAPEWFFQFLPLAAELASKKEG